MTVHKLNATSGQESNKCHEMGYVSGRQEEEGLWHFALYFYIISSVRNLDIHILQVY